MLDHSTVCFEEALFSQGFALQSRCLESGVETNAPSRVPPPPHFKFASTVAVHPNLTTRTHEKDRQVASNDALKYLRHAINTVDAKDGGLKDAFRFESSRSQSERSRRARTRNSELSNASDDESEKPGFIRSSYYKKQSLWRHAEDFWAIVGWAFNCSVLHKGRWKRWKAWLEQMLDVLQNDLEKHIRLKESENADMGESLLAQYISTVGDGRNNRRRIMRAITADGTKRMVAEFGEIWKNETKPPKKKKEEHPSKRRKLDIDNNQFGDYGDSDSEVEGSEGRRRKSVSASAQSTRSMRSKEARQPAQDNEVETGEDETEADGLTSALTGVDGFGGMDSIRLRQRLLALLTSFSQVALDNFMDTEELFSLFTEFLRPLPLPIFQQFVLPLKPFLSTDLQASLLEMLFRPLLGSNNGRGKIDQNMFETSFAPHAAMTSSATDNAKVSLLAESLLRALWRSDNLLGDMGSLRVSIKKGIKAREDKVAYDGRKKVGRNFALDEQARTLLQCSAERMLVLLDVMAS